MRSELAFLLMMLGVGAQARPLRIVTTTTDLASVAREIAGDRAEVVALASGRQNPHFVEAKPSLVLKVMKADVFIETGLELEVGWAPLLLRGARNRRLLPGKPGRIDASEAIEALEVPEKLSRSMGDVHPGGNPHYLQDPERAIRVARFLVERLSLVRPEEKEVFQGRLSDFEAKLGRALKRWKAALAPAVGTKFISYHRDWVYFANRFGFRPAGEIEPKPGIPPTASHTARLIERMKAEEIELIFTNPWFESRTPRSIAASTGGRVLEMALFPGARAGTGDYFAWMDYNVRMIAEVLGQNGGTETAAEMR